jgi:hypothetical protein
VSPNGRKSQGYVYHAQLSLDELQSLIEQLHVEVVLSWDLVRLDFSGEIRENGSAFNDHLEVRWRKAGAQMSLLVLSDTPIEQAGLQPVSGNWTREAMYAENEPESIPTLIALEDKRYAPQFDAYPGINRSRGHLACQTFYRDGIAIFLSPRKLTPLEGGS